MSDYSSDDEGHRRRKSSKGNNSAIQTLEYLSEISTGAEVMMNSTAFKMTNVWLGRKTGLNLKHVVLALGIFMATRSYSNKAMQWLQDNGCNSLEIDSNEPIAEDLELWVAQQPLNQQTLRLLCLVPSFQNMEWKNVGGPSEGSNTWNGDVPAVEDEKKGYEGYEFVASTGKSFFTFRGKLFSLEKQKFGNAKIRCFWGTQNQYRSW